MAPNVEMPEIELLVDKRDQPRNLFAPVRRHLQIEGAGKMQPLDVVAPVDAKVQIAP
jgi:hypothetical protein